VLVLAVGVLTLRTNDTVQNFVFHSSEHSPSTVSSNAGRAYALQQGVNDALHHPLGRGPGTAGPASFRNDGELPRIAENYYLQLTQEVGLIGLALFIFLNVAVAQELLRRRQDLLSVVLLASLIGLSVVNMFSHAWADDTLGMLWWGLAGIAISTTPPAILNKERKTRGTSKKKQQTA
jgi:O-antigen ligase